jgi:glutamate dehydrogenase
MEQTADGTRDRLERVLAALGRGSPDRPDPLREFAALLLSRASADLFQDVSASDLAAQVRSLFALLEATEPGEISVRVRAFDRPERTVLQSVMPDCAFIVTTLRAAARARGLEIPHLLHPVVVVRRAADGSVTRVEERSAEGPTTSVVWMLLEGSLEEETCRVLESEVTERMQSVRLVNEDFRPMLECASETAAQLTHARAEVPARSAELQEVQALLNWLADGNFVFLGSRSYDLSRDETGEPSIVLRPGTGLGILRDEARSSFRAGRGLGSLAPELRDRMLGGPLLIVSKTNAESPVHRTDRMDYIGIKRLGAGGRVAGEQRFLGLLTAKAYNQDPSEIPILRHKLRELLQDQGAVRGSHDYRLIFDFFGSMPLEELFLSSVSELSGLVAELMEAEGAEDVRVRARPDALARGVNVTVVLPKHRFSGEARQRVQETLVSRYEGTLLNYHLALGESDQARLHFYIAADRVRVEAVDATELEEAVRACVRTWEERLTDGLRVSRRGDGRARPWERHLFPAEYRAAVDPERAVADLRCLERLVDSGRPQLVFEPAAEPRPNRFVLKAFVPKGRLVLSDAMPVLESFGFRVFQAVKFDVGTPDGGANTIHTFEVEVPAEWKFDPSASAPRVERAVWAIIDGDAENDALNALVLSAGLEWREVALLRAYAGYAFRSGAVGSRTGAREPLVRYPEMAGLLVALFRSRFDPESSDREETKRLFRRFRRLLEPVSSIEDDRTFRRLLALLGATVRTTYFQKTGAAGRIALKFDCTKLDYLPRPRPRFEVYVNSPTTEGCHLRMGSVARGGIRWSDRYEDFRVEVLGLVKTQQVKNALIVPAGAKGAFIVKRPRSAGLPGREAAIESYREFISSLLDLADDIRGGEIVHRGDTVRLDGDDPYLVVAADKGTATLSDAANALAAERGFWLGDAFASGGSRGYDHKALGITARGAWECVRRHFREMGTDIQVEPFTVAGIGDMSGDVFGNGMLLSRQIRLVAAFDHRHILLDPSPEPERSWIERKRLFDTPGCTWADYDVGLLSEGGGVWERGAKRIDLSAQAREALGLSKEDGPSGALNGEELVRAVLKAPVDLLWNGGIGTYVKASEETHAAVGDPSNDGVRIDASQLRARVVGEGGNLGLTQWARTEYALGGGRLNTDAIDNSGGVDLSDHEVNLKIFLSRAVETGSLDDKGRDALLSEVTDRVVEAVLANSRSQSLALSLDEHRARGAPQEFHVAQLQLERLRLLDPGLEFLPDSDEYAERLERGAFLTRPELSILLAYAKMHLKGEIQRSDLANDPALVRLAREYFPAEALAVDDGLLSAFPLRARLIATELTNRFVDSMGSTTHLRLIRETGRPAWEIARAWFAAAEIAEIDLLYGHLEPLEGEIASGTLNGWHLSVAEALERCTLWILFHCDPSWSSARLIDWLGDPVRTLRSHLREILPVGEQSEWDARQSRFQAEGLPAPVARQLAAIEALDELLPVARLARLAGLEAWTVGVLYLRLSELVDYRWLRSRLHHLAGSDPWTRRAAKTLERELEDALTETTRQILEGLPTDATVPDAEPALAEFRERHADGLSRIRRVLDEVRALERPTLPALTVAVHAIRHGGG